MTKVSFPASFTGPMANRATQIARASAVSRGWKSSDSLTPVSGVGFFGIATSKKYHMYQERGTKPFLMTSLEGKTVPINGRFIRVKNVGKPGFVHLPDGSKIWRDQKWRHPGLKPTNMMRDAVERTMIEYKGEVLVLLSELMGVSEQRKYL